MKKKKKRENEPQTSTRKAGNQITNFQHQMLAFRDFFHKHGLRRGSLEPFSIFDPRNERKIPTKPRAKRVSVDVYTKYENRDATSTTYQRTNSTGRKDKKTRLRAHRTRAERAPTRQLVAN